MMMSNGQIYSQGMEIMWQTDAGPGPQDGSPSWSPPLDTGNMGGNQSIDDPFSPHRDDPVTLVTDAFTGNAGFNPPAGGNPGGNLNLGGDLSVWTDIWSNAGGDVPPSGDGNPGNYGTPGPNDFRTSNRPL